MARPLRLEFAGALYHVTARGNKRRNIFLGDADSDRAAFVDVLAATCERCNTGAYSMQAIAEHFDVSRMTVSRAVKRQEDAAADGYVMWGPDPFCVTFCDPFCIRCCIRRIRK